MSYDWRNYISVMTPPATSGNLTFTVETFDALSNVSLTFNVSSTGAEDEQGLALAIESQLNTLLIQASANFNGQPVFSNYSPAASFYVDRTEHVVSFWSQAQYRLQLTSNPLGASIRIASSPTLITLARAQALAPLLGVDFTDFNENSLTTTQIMDLLELASGQIINLTNNYMVIACYLMEVIGNMTGAIKLKSKPVLDYDAPYIVRPNLLMPITLPILQTGYAYEIVRDLGVFQYRYDNNILSVWDPFEMRNEIKMTYRAGLLNIPRIVQEKVIQISALALNNTNVKVLKGGSASVEFRLPQEVLNSISQELAQFRVRR